MHSTHLEPIHLYIYIYIYRASLQHHSTPRAAQAGPYKTTADKTMRHLPLSLATAAFLRATTAQQPLNESDILGTLDSLLNSLDGSVANSTIDDVYAYVSDQAQAGLQAVLKYIFPEQYWSYGRSPPVYPTRKSITPRTRNVVRNSTLTISPKAVGGDDPAWEEAYAQASALVAQLDYTQLASLTLGSSDTRGCSGFIDPVAGFTGMCLQDNENGVRGSEQSSGFPSQLSIGASWNRSLALERAQFLGREFKALGANVLLGPVGGPLGRIARGGRNWEGEIFTPRTPFCSHMIKS